MLVKHTNGLVAFDVPDGSPIVMSVLKNRAAEQLAQYPQYAGYHDGAEWYVVRFTKRVTTKGGVRFEAGDLALCRDRDEVETREGLTYPTAYSERGAIHCAVDPKSFVRVSA